MVLMFNKVARGTNKMDQKIVNTAITKVISHARVMRFERER